MIERWGPAIERLRQGMSAPALTQARRGSITVRSSAHSLRSSATVHEDQVCRSPILESFIFRDFVTRTKPYDF